MILRLLGAASERLRRERTLAGIGAAALALAVGVVFLPGPFAPAVFRPISRVLAAPATIATVGLLAGLLGALAVRRKATDSGGRGARSGGGRGSARTGGASAADDLWTPDRPPERAYYDEYRTAGSGVDVVFDADPEEWSGLDARRRDARSRIRKTAVSVVAADESVGEDTAAERIAEGAWTDDPRAAAFLGGRRYAPLRIRIRDWASGERFERWASAAVEAIEARERGKGGREASAEADRSQRPTARSGRRPDEQ